MDIFSPREREIIKILGKKKLTLLQIAGDLFKKESKPLEPAITVNNSVRRINKKCEYHQFLWKLEVTKLNGKSIIKRVML